MKGLAIILLLAVGSYAMQETVQKKLQTAKDRFGGKGTDEWTGNTWDHPEWGTDAKEWDGEHHEWDGEFEGKWDGEWNNEWTGGDWNNTWTDGEHEKPTHGGPGGKGGKFLHLN